MKYDKNKVLFTYSGLREKGISSPCVEIESDLFLKLELTLPTGSYKIRGAYNFFDNNSVDSIKVLSAGNLALACAHLSREYNFELTAVVPEKISSIKETKLKELGARLEKKSFEYIWELAESSNLISSTNFLHPLHEDLLCGYSSIVPEAIEQIGNYDNIVIPYGLGGLAASIVRTCKIFNKKISVYLVEIKNHSPFERAKKFNNFHKTEPLTSFIEAMGTPNVLEQVFLEIRSDIKDVITVDESEVRRAIRDLYLKYRIKAEGAAGATYAAARILKKQTKGKTLAILTGSNISDPIFQEICNEQANH